MADDDRVQRLKKLREPFPPNQISKLPKETKTQADERKTNMAMGVKCKLCGGWHHKNAVHLDYVGHAALTDRLLDVDPLWNWEPVTRTPDGAPALDNNKGMWIKLTVCDQTRLGYGHAEGKTGGDAIKEVIGDALRNAAMRFGAALDLWHKGDLHADDAEPEPAPQPARLALPRRDEPTPFDPDFDPEDEASKVGDIIRGCGTAEALAAFWTTPRVQEFLKANPIFRETLTATKDARKAQLMKDAA